MKDEAHPVAADKNIGARYFTTLPIFFPLIGLFLFALTLFEAWSFVGDNSVYFLYQFRPVVMLLYFIFWSAACLGRKWGGIAFITLTILNVAYHLFGPDSIVKNALGDMLFLPIPANLLFSFLLLFYFRKLK